MPTLYLHIGRGKTGTTLIQQYLADKRIELLNMGVHYLGAAGGARGRGHQEFAKSFVTSAPGFMIPAATPEKTRRAVADELCNLGSEIALMSSENFAIADIAALADFLRDLPVQFDIKIIFFARSQDELAESEYNQIVKLKRLTVSLDEYANSHIEGCDFYQTAQDWAAHFGRENIICRVFDGQKNVVPLFLGCIPAIVPARLSDFTPKADAANASIGIQALWMARILNGIEINKRGALYDMIFEHMSGADLPALFFNSAQARAYRGRFAKSNLAFSTHYLGHPSEDLGGRRYSDEKRDRIIAEINRLKRQM
jgi:hypothetical protein